MVLLDKYTFWCPHRPCHFILLQGLYITKTQNKPPWTTTANGSSWYTCIHPRRRLPSVMPAMGRHQIQLEQRSNNCPICSIRRIRFCVVCYPGLEAGRRYSTASFTQESKCAWGSDSRNIFRWIFFCLRILCGFSIQSYQLHC